MKMSHSLRTFGRVIALLVFLLNGLPQKTVQADIGLPPINPSGSTLGLPGGERTNVRMVEEEVNLTIEPSVSEVPGGYHMLGRVEAVFQMHNLGVADEALDVWFPLATSVRYAGMLAEYKPDDTVQDFKVWVDGRAIPFKQIKAPDLGDPSQESAWASFPITFPAGKVVNVRVTYTLYPSGRWPFGDFEYILQTGASWKETIGKAVIQVILPYPVTEENVSLRENPPYDSPITPQPSNYVIKDNVLRWEFTNLEPGSGDNISVNILEPNRYEDLLKARSRAANEPNSAETQFALAEATSHALVIIKGVWLNGGGPELGKQVNVAYRRALELAPDQENILVSYITYLMLSGGEGSLLVDGTCPVELCDLLDRALKLYPDNSDLQMWSQEVQSAQADAEYRNQVSTEQAATASAESQLATSLAETSVPTSTLPAPIPALTQAMVQPAAISAADTPSTLHEAEATPTQKQSEEVSGQAVVAFMLPLVLIAAVAFTVRLGRRRHRKP